MSGTLGDQASPTTGYRTFAMLWGARILSTVAFQVQVVAIGWQIYALTGRALDLGLIGLSQFIPMVLLTLVVGQVADRFNRAAVIGICQAIEATAALALTLGVMGEWLGRNGILAIVAVVGSARAFEAPTMAALMPGLVPQSVVHRATAWFASATQSAQIVGPALGGVLYGLTPVAAYGLAAVLFATAAGLAIAIGTPPHTRAGEPLTLSSIFSGVAFIRSQPLLFGTLSLDLFAVLFGGATALLPIYARDILQTGPWGLGLLRSALALGSLTMAVWLAYRPIERRLGVKLFTAVIVFGAATFVFGISSNLVLSLSALVVLGASDVVSVVIRMTLVQLRTPDAMRGRVSAINSLFIGTSNQLGEFESGLTAALIGVVPSVVMGASATIAIALLWMYLFPALRRVHSFIEEVNVPSNVAPHR